MNEYISRFQTQLKTIRRSVISINLIYCLIYKMRKRSHRIYSNSNVAASAVIYDHDPEVNIILLFPFFVDYSCALQKEILVHGRLYVTQNLLCFYANIFGWETLVSIRWKDVTAITKEKVALVIPNAILVCTESDKMFFTSFGTRDKAYLMLFRVWQNALMGKQMGQSEMWQWVRQIIISFFFPSPAYSVADATDLSRV